MPRRRIIGMPVEVFMPYVGRGLGDVLLVYGLNTSTGMVGLQSTMQGVVPDKVRGRVFTLLDVTWNAVRLLSLASLALGGILVHAVGIRPLFWLGGALLALAGLLGLALLGRYDFRTA